MAEGRLQFGASGSLRNDERLHRDPSVIDEDRIRQLVRRVVYRAVGRPLSASPVTERPLVTEQNLRDVPTGGEFAVPNGALITPLARQVAMERRISLTEGCHGTCEAAAGAGPAAGAETIAIGADHGGFKLKEQLGRHLREQGYAVLDCGTHSSESVDYPDLALAVAQLVAQSRAGRGILVDGAGIGSCMAANKVPGVRAAMCYDEATALNCREHNDANVLTLGAGMIDAKMARRIVDTWLKTPAGGGRHARRVNKIMDIESRFLRNS